jgi:hypothetical protein
MDTTVIYKDGRKISAPAESRISGLCRNLKEIWKFFSGDDL